MWDAGCNASSHGLFLEKFLSLYCSWSTISQNRCHKKPETTFPLGFLHFQSKHRKEISKFEHCERRKGPRPQSSNCPCKLVGVFCSKDGTSYCFFWVSKRFLRPRILYNTLLGCKNTNFHRFLSTAKKRHIWASTAIFQQQKTYNKRIWHKL